MASESDSERSKLSQYGRKQKEINLDKLKAFMRTFPTLEQTASFFEMTQKGIADVIHQNFGQTFYEFREQNLSETRNLIANRLIEMAIKDKNLGALIWLSKQFLGWSENVRLSQVGHQQGGIQLKYALTEPPPQPDVKDVTPPQQQD